MKLTIALFAMVSVAATLVSAGPKADDKDGGLATLLSKLTNQDRIKTFDQGDSRNYVYSYQPVEPSSSSSNEIKRKSSLVDVMASRAELEDDDDDNRKPLAETPKAAPSLEDLRRQFNDPKDIEKVKSIAFNSREVRLMGPEQKEVEMKDDLPTKVVVVLDNLKNEAHELWGQVNEKLDKGWGEVKGMVDKLLSQQKSGAQH